MIQLSQPYMTIGKTIALTIWTFVGKEMALHFSTLSSFVIAFLSRNKCLHFKGALTVCTDFGAPQNKVSCCFHCFPIYLPWSDRTRCHNLRILSFKPDFSLSSFTRRLTAYSFDVLCSHICTSSLFPCLILTVASWPAYKFLRRQVRWSSIPISLRIFHSLLWSTQSKTLA